MKKNMKWAALVLSCALCLEGCSIGEKDLAAKDYKAADYLTLGEYKGLSVNEINQETELDDEEKANALESALENYSEEAVITDRAAKEGDYLSLSYVCKQDGEEVDSSEDQGNIETQLGSNDFFDADQEKELIGVKTGDEKTIESEYAGEDGEDAVVYTYEVKVEKIYSVEIPELTDEFAKEQGYDSADDMEESIYADTLAANNSDYEAQAQEDLVNTVKESSTLNDDYPEDLYNSTLDELNDVYSDYFGMTLEEMYEGDEDSVKEAVLDSLKQELVIEAIAQKENIKVTESDLDAYKTEIVSQYDEYEDTSDLEEEYDDETLIDSLLNSKVQEYLLSEAKVTYVSAEEYYESEDTGSDVLMEGSGSGLSELEISDVTSEMSEIPESSVVSETSEMSETSQTS